MAEFDGVVNEVIGHLGDSVQIPLGVDGILGEVHSHIQTLVVDFLLKGNQHLPQAFGHVEPDHFFRRNPLILKAGHVQHTPHQAAQAFDLAGDQSQIFPLPLRRDGTVQDAVHIAADGGHRRL